MRRDLNVAMGQPKNMDGLSSYRKYINVMMSHVRLYDIAYFFESVRYRAITILD